MHTRAPPPPPHTHTQKNKKTYTHGHTSACGRPPGASNCPPCPAHIHLETARLHPCAQRVQNSRVGQASVAIVDYIRRHQAFYLQSGGSGVPERMLRLGQGFCAALFLHSVCTSFAALTTQVCFCTSLTHIGTPHPALYACKGCCATILTWQQVTPILPAAAAAGKPLATTRTRARRCASWWPNPG
jgi:hypothetical protein